MQPQLATAIGAIYTTLGVRQFSEIDNNRLTGMQVITSGNVPSGYVVAIHAPSVAIADEGGIDISASTEASVEMEDNPTAGNYHLISGLRDKGVFYLTNAAYGGAVT
jgi:hypothetical protein